MTLSITCRCFGGLPGDKDCSVKHLDPQILEDAAGPNSYCFPVFCLA